LRVHVVMTGCCIEAEAEGDTGKEERRPRARPARDPEEQERRERLRRSDKHKTAASLNDRWG